MCQFADWGSLNYQIAWEKQRFLQQQLIENHSLPHQLVFVEHPHVYTFGKNANHNNLLINKNQLQTLQATVFDIERGGDITYHGPGQLVVYPIFNLKLLNIGIKQFVQNIENAIIDTLQEFGIQSSTIPNMIGVWVETNTINERKIAAIGIKITKFVSLHGLALNVNPNLVMFDNIIPCGLENKQVTSMEKELNKKIDMFEVKKSLKLNFSNIFELDLI